MMSFLKNNNKLEINEIDNKINEKQLEIIEENKDLNEIQFLRTTLSTVMKRFEIQNDENEIFNSIDINENIFSNGKILSKYYKNKDSIIEIEGNGPEKIKCFPKTITIFCSNDDNYKFKIRWFYSKKINKVHLASGLNQNEAAKYLEEFICFMKSKLKISNILDTDYVLLNGIAQAKLGLNLYDLAERLKEESDLSVVFTPDNHASLKIYTKFGTVCCHSTGKILYMGCKNMEVLHKLHDFISEKGKFWKGVPISYIDTSDSKKRKFTDAQQNDNIIKKKTSGSGRKPGIWYEYWLNNVENASEEHYKKLLPPQRTSLKKQVEQLMIVNNINISQKNVSDQQHKKKDKRTIDKLTNK